MPTQLEIFSSPSKIHLPGFHIAKVLVLSASSSPLQGQFPRFLYRHSTIFIAAPIQTGDSTEENRSWISFGGSHIMSSIRGRHGPGRPATSASANSESGRVVVRAAAVDTMRTYFPQWTLANLVSPESRARLKAQELSMDQVESPFTDFYLSCNWIFRPDALAEFMGEMRKLPTVSYHPCLFRCLIRRSFYSIYCLFFHELNKV